MSKKVLFRLLGEVSPVSWELPLRNIFLPKKDERNGTFADKLVAYRKGAPSIWDEDYKGDLKPISAVYFENGTLEVDETDVLLLEILEKHRFAGKRYERYDPNTSAEKQLEIFALRDKANNLVSVSGEVRVKAMAMALIGQETISFTEIQALAALKQKAYDDPKALIEEYNKPDYEAKYVVGLAYLKGVIKDNESQTQVVWADTGASILPLAVGENGLDQMSKFLATRTEQSTVLLQRLGTLVADADKQDASTTTTDSAPTTTGNLSESVEKVLSEKDAEIAELKRQLAEKAVVNKPEVVVVADEVIKGSPDGNKKEDENEEEEDPALLEARQQYLKVIGKEVPVNKKNNLDWINEKIQEGKQ